MLRSLALSLLLVPAVALAASKDPAQARSEAFVAAFLEVKPGVPAAANQKAFAKLDGFLDFDTIIADSTKPLEAKLKPADLKAFRTEFRELMRLIAYTNSGDFFRRAKLTWGTVAKGEAGRVDVPFVATLPDEDLESGVTLHWHDVAGALKVADVSFDGESLIADYRNQFVRVADKEGGPGLLKKLRERRAAVDKELVKGAQK